MGRYRIFCWGAIANLVLVAAVQGQTAPIEVHLAWDPSPDTNVAGYYIYIGPRSGFYTSRIDVGNVTNATVGNLSSGTYYFIASAYSPDRVESLPSNEVNGFWTKLDMKLGADQFMHLNFLVTSNRLFDLQVTSTFSNWTTISTVSSTTATNIDVADQDWTTSPYKFYRLVPR